MKKQAYTVIAMIVLVGSMAVAAKAQISGRTRMIVDIPFEFIAGSKTLPSGEYTVTRLDSASDHTAVQLRSNDGGTSAMVQMTSISGKAQEDARLVFNRYGNRYFFSQAWADDLAGVEASRSRAERVAQRELANLRRKSDTIALRVQ